MEHLESDVEKFLYEHTGPLFDVRSPCEFLHGAIPNSISLPLFSDKERHAVGCCYKQQGKREAILLGLGFVGPKMQQFAFTLLSQNHAQVRILCFRGGMRSSSMAWLAQTVGLSVVRLCKGYKSYRKWVLEALDIPFAPLIISGPTGSGKTELLQLLAQKKYPILDLEQLACHRGSVFGGLEYEMQPSQEQFENKLASALFSVKNSPYVCVEAESRMIGRLVLPKQVYERVHSGPLLHIECPFEERLFRIVEQYGTKSKEELLGCVSKIQKRLGGAVTQEVARYIAAGNLCDAARLLLQYYDATYAHCQKFHTGKRIVVSRDEVVQAIESATFESFVHATTVERFT